MDDNEPTVDKRWYTSKEAFWALVGVLATILLGVPSIYYAVHEKQPHILYEIVSESEVLDARQPLQQLEIRYKGEDIYAQKRSLRVITLLVRNDGETHIRPDDFDPSMPWGLRVVNGQLVDLPKLVADNDTYLSNNIDIHSDTNTFISFHKLIFDRSKYFGVELQVLHREAVDPQLEVLGKIAGIEHQSVTRIRKENGASRGFWGEVFGGSYRVQVFRLSFYGIIIAFSLLVSLAAPEGVKRLKRRVYWRRLMPSATDYLTPLVKKQSKAESDVLVALFVLSRGNFATMKRINDGQLNAQYPFVSKSNGELKLCVASSLPHLIAYMENAPPIPNELYRLLNDQSYSNTIMVLTFADKIIKRSENDIESSASSGIHV